MTVDDEPGILKVVDIYLRLHGYEVITTNSGAEAIGLVKKQEPDAILLDILMPEVNGLEVLTEVRKFSRVPVIAFTANQQMAEKAVKLGANTSFAKPFNPDVLLEKIKLILDHKHES